MAKKVLTGTQYTESRLYGIIAEMFYNNTGRLPRENDVTTQLTGSVITNATTGNVGYVLDSDCRYFGELSEPHVGRLANVVEGDGWLDTVEEA